jgi:hypothetical protein
MAKPMIFPISKIGTPAKKKTKTENSNMQAIFSMQELGNR